MNIYGFEPKDIVRLRNRKQFKVSRLDDGKYALFTILDVKTNGVILQEVADVVPFDNIEPVSITDKGAKYIYYDYVVAASTVDSFSEVPIRSFDMPYFMDAFRKVYSEDRTLYYDIVKHEKFEFVHEVQHWLRKNHSFDDLRINESELINSYIKNIEEKGKKDDLYYMRLSIDEMRKSIQEPREDGKVSPCVGAVLLKPNGKVVTAHRGELREGDHAEFTLLERKCLSEDLKGSIVFSTLEPCFERNMPKVACSQRLVDARIAKVYIGIEDPDPTVSGKGIDLLRKNGVEIAMYPRELQKEIEEYNSDFLKGALQRREKKMRDDSVSSFEKAIEISNLSMVSENILIKFLDKLNIDPNLANIDTQSALIQLGILEQKEKELKLTGYGLLLFGRNPQYTYTNAVIKATYTKEGKEQSVTTIEGPIIEQSTKLYEWYKDFVPHHIDRSEPNRKTIYEYPMDVISEVVKNAIVHRDYNIKEAPIYFNISEDKIVVTSPGLPVVPITKGQMQMFNAPSRSRNPLIMYVFDKLELAEQRGLGFKTIKELPSKGFALPDVDCDDANITITLPFIEGKLSGKLSALTERQRKLYDYIKQNAPVTRKDVESYLSVETKTAEREIKTLIDTLLISRIGDGPSCKYVLN